MVTAMSKPKAKVSASDRDNIFQLLNACQAAAKRADWSYEQIQAFMAEARSGDLAHLQNVVKQHFDIC